MRKGISTQKQTGERIKYLKRKYTQWRDNKKLSGAAPLRFEYGPLLDEFLGQKPNIVPVALADTSAADDPTLPTDNVGDALKTPAEGKLDYK